MVQLTNRERMLRILRGGDLDRIPFVHHNCLAAPNDEIWKLLGRDKMAISKWTNVHRCENDVCKRFQEKLVINGKEITRDTIVTPKGTIFQDKAPIAAYHTEGYVKHFVENEEDLLILAEYYRNFKVYPDLTNYLAALKLVGDDGLPYCNTARTPYQILVTEYADIEQLAYIMMDYPEIYEEACEALGKHFLDICDAIAVSSKEIDIPIINIPENATAPLIGKKIYKESCMPYYKALKEKLGDANITVFAHFDGELKGIWDEVKASALDGIDSFTPVPTGDTTISEALSLWDHGRIMCNFPSSVHIAPEEEIYNTAKQILEDGGHSKRMWIAISENVPARAWKTSFTQISRAIDDFGRP